ncbi:MAG TPA: FAD-dependent oxidoreductase [Alphaproteobacteria bacterium]|nr:FAD-dependent oxidoreductase [Alphaproteobacteria bacterium]
MKVLIVGAGVVGITTAYYLRADGHEITVIERQTGAGLETSFANAGQLCRYTARPWAAPSVPSMIIREFGRADAPFLVHLRADPAMWRWLAKFLLQCRGSKHQTTRSNLMRIAVHSANLMDELVKTENVNFNHERNGVLHLFRNQKSLDHATDEERHVENREARGEVLNRDGCITIEPALAQNPSQFIGGIFHRHEQTGDAHRFTKELSKILKTRGVIFRYGVNAQQILSKGNRVSGLSTDQGVIESDAVVISAANSSAQLLNSAYPKLPIYPVKGYSITVQTSGFNGAPKIGIQDHSRKIGFSRLGEQLRAAGTAEFGARDDAPDHTRIEALCNQTRILFPGAGEFETAKTWAGLRPMTPDGAPIVGRTKWKNLFVNTGHGSLGWSLACGSSHIIADVVSERTPTIDLTGLTIDRFA